jgi:hypothetical protein
MSRAQPALHVTLGPLTVTGSNFRAGESVTVIASVPPQTLTGRAVAAGNGSFVVQFASVMGAPHGLHVRAAGSEGSAAIYAPRVARLSPPTT